jgi:hypothetical protein
MPTIPTPKPDASGGFLILQYTTPTDSHRLRIHIAPFNYDSGTRWDYNPVVGSGAEGDIFDTFDNLAAVLAPMVPTTAAITLLSVFQMVSGSPVERFGYTAPSAVAGTYGGAAPTDQNRAAQTNYNFATTAGGRAKVAIAGGLAVGAATLPTIITASTGGTAIERALVGYVSSANTGIRGHDGAQLNPSAHRTTALNKRLRRKYGFM